MSAVHQYGIDAVFSVTDHYHELGRGLPRRRTIFIALHGMRCRDFAGQDCDGRMTTGGKPLYFAPKLTRQSPLRRRPPRGDGRREESPGLHRAGCRNARGNHDQCNREQTADGPRKLGSGGMKQVWVERTARLVTASRHGKLHPEQGQIGFTR